MSGRLAVLGAINVDLVVSGAALPRPGETVTGGTFARHQGGKGGNQATAAARAAGGEGPVVLIGAVGDDDLGAAARAELEREGVDVVAVRAVAGAATGVALISVDETGENQISVAPGANDAVGDPTEALERSRPTLVLASAEVPLATLEAAADWCIEHEVPFVLNPAPVSESLWRLLDRTAILTPNEHEAVALGGGTDPMAAARALRDDHPNLKVVLTRGQDGAVVLDDGGELPIPAPAVRVVDSTGAGDCLSGVLAAGLTDGLALRAATERAVRAASMSVTVAGARAGMPMCDVIDG
ncbi:MAG TPA: ribokinase [Actinomycetota bacterium]|nr:ribokinase [Actinomycetota bacterium]